MTLFIRFCVNQGKINDLLSNTLILFCNMDFSHEGALQGF